MNCPKCNGLTIKWGKRQGRQAFKCKECQYQTIDPCLQQKRGRPKLIDQNTCKICGKKVHAKDLCQNHYRQMMRQEAKEQ